MKKDDWRDHFHGSDENGVGGWRWEREEGWERTCKATMAGEERVNAPLANSG